MPLPAPETRDSGTVAVMPGSGLSVRQLKLVTALAFCVSMLLVIFPRFATVITFSIFLGIVLLDPLVRYWRGLPQVEWIRFKTVEPFFWPFLLFWGWAALSLLWSANPAGGLSKVTLLGGLIIMCLGTGEGIRVADRRLLSAIVAGFVAGIAAVAIYIFFESVSARGLSRFLVKHMTYLAPLDHKHVQIQKNGTVMVSDANLNRSTAVFSLMLWPAVLGTLSFLPTWRRTLVNLVFFATGVALLIWSRHQSSQIALIASGLVFAAGLFYPLATRRVLAGPQGGHGAGVERLGEVDAGDLGPQRPGHRLDPERGVRGGGHDQTIAPALAAGPPTV